jgi:hypothetical protein
VFTAFEGDYFTVELQSKEVSAAHRVWGYTDCQTLVDLLFHVAKQERGWPDSPEWSSIERDLILRFSSDPLGHVVVQVVMTQRRGAEDWSVRAEIETELGQLPKIASRAAAFFSGDIWRLEP